MAIFKNYNASLILNNLEKRLRISVSPNYRYRIKIEGNILNGNFRRNLTQLAKINRFLRGYLSLEKDKIEGESLPFNSIILNNSVIQTNFLSFSAEEYYFIKKQLNKIIKDFSKQNNIKADDTASYFSRISNHEAGITFYGDIMKEKALKDDNLFKKFVDYFTNEIYKLYKDFLFKLINKFEGIVKQEEPLLSFIVDDAIKFEIFLDDIDVFYKDFTNERAVKFKVNVEMLKEYNPKTKKIINFFIEDFKKNINNIVAMYYNDIVEYIPRNDEYIYHVSKCQADIITIAQFLEEENKILALIN